MLLGLAMPRDIVNILRPNDEIVPDDEGAEFATFGGQKVGAMHSAPWLAIEVIKTG